MVDRVLVPAEIQARPLEVRSKIDFEECPPWMSEFRILLQLLGAVLLARAGSPDPFHAPAQRTRVIDYLGEPGLCDYREVKNATFI